MLDLWHDLLYQPLLSALFFLYDRFAGENMGVAVIELTIAMRMLLLPLSIIAERKQWKLEALSARIAEVRRTFKNDPVRQREATRKLLREERVSPWAKFAGLGFQVLIFVLLYQVFLNGLSAAKLNDLYEGIRRPDVVNILFLSFNIAEENVWWAIGVGVLLFVEIAIAQAQRRHTLDRADIFYRYAFPVSVAIILAQLPMVKSIFILTSMAFSALLYGVRKGIEASA